MARTMTTRRHPAFQNPQQPKALDTSPNALTPKEVAEVQNALDCGYTPRARLIRKMLNLAPKQTTFSDGRCVDCLRYDGSHFSGCKLAPKVAAPAAPPSQAEKLSDDEDPLQGDMWGDVL